MAKDESVYTQMIKIWVDDEREMPEGYTHLARSADDAFWLIREFYYDDDGLEVSLDHDAGRYADQGGDYIKILERLEEICYGNPNFRNYIRDKVIFHLHTANPVGRENMRRVIQKNGWREV